VRELTDNTFCAPAYDVRIKQKKATE